ncbi:MAG: T9SS type A sorting domain-containing protein [Bacteroidota bacterium]
MKALCTKTTLFIILIFLVTSGVKAQNFKLKPGEKQKTFKEIQLEFNNWKNSVDVSKEHYWKYFKRWENDMQMHTDAKGEPADPTGYFLEAIKTADFKNEQNADAPNLSGWYPVGPNAVPANETGYMNNGIGRINCIAFSPTNTSTYFVGVAQGGVWKTTNNGISWTPLTDNLPITRISDIAIDPANSNVMYISVCDFEYIGFSLLANGKKRQTHYGLGVYKTTDGGATWSPTGLTFLLTDGDASLIRKILVNPANSNQVVACGVSGMYISNDAGASWTKQIDELFWDMVQDPVNPSVIYAATGWVLTSGIGHAGIYKSTNFAGNWTLLPTSIPTTGLVQRIKLAVAPSDNNYMYAISVDTDGGLYGFYKSTNAGNSWIYSYPTPGNILEGGNTGSGIGGQGNFDLALCVDPTNKNTVYAGGVNIWVSVDGAATFTMATHWTTNYGTSIHGDIHFIETQPVSKNVFVCNDGGLYRTPAIAANWSNIWTNLSDGMAITAFYRISSSKTTDGRLIAGAQDNATFYFNGLSWKTIFGGDGMDNYLDPLNPNLLVGESQYGTIWFTTTGGLPYNWSNVSSENGEWTTPLVANYSVPGVLYAGYENVWKSTNNGSSWTRLTAFPPNTYYNTEISALAVANSDNNTLYVGKRVRYEYGESASLYRSFNDGLSWTNITAGTPDSLYITSVDVSQTNKNIVYVTYAGFSEGNKVYKSINGGATWTNISYNLPNIPVNCIKTIPGDDYVMIATDLGVYVLENSTTTWKNKSTGLPNVIVSDIEFNVALNKIYVSTFGRGIWATDLSFLLSQPELPKANKFAFNIFPSPNKGNFKISFPDEILSAKEIKFTLINVLGREVYTENLQGKNTFEFNLNLLPGVYYAKVNFDKSVAVKSFIVE